MSCWTCVGLSCPRLALKNRRSDLCGRVACLAFLPDVTWPQELTDEDLSPGLCEGKEGARGMKGARFEQLAVDSFALEENEHPVTGSEARIHSLTSLFLLMTP